MYLTSEQICDRTKDLTSFNLLILRQLWFVDQPKLKLYNYFQMARFRQPLQSILVCVSLPLET
jgi:hypothetical protein